MDREPSPADRISKTREERARVMEAITDIVEEVKSAAEVNDNFPPDVKAALLGACRVKSGEVFSEMADRSAATEKLSPEDHIRKILIDRIVEETTGVRKGHDASVLKFLHRIALVKSRRERQEAGGKWPHNFPG